MAEKSERLKIIETVVDPQKSFKVHDVETNAKILASQLPDGIAFEAKNRELSKLFKLLKGLNVENSRVEAFIKELADERYIWSTVHLLEEWEKDVGIPDECFKIENKTIDFRIRQVIAKLSLMRKATTEQDYIDLAKFFDVDIKIENCVTHSVFPLTFPIIFTDSVKTAAFTMVVTIFTKEVKGFPYTLPITFEADNLEFLKCAIRKIAPANYDVIFLYQEQT